MKNNNDFPEEQDTTYCKYDSFYEPLKDVHSFADLYRLFQKMNASDLTITNKTEHTRYHSNNTFAGEQDDCWLTTDEVVKKYPISKRTLQNLRNRKILHFSRSGKKCCYKKKDVDDYMNRNYTGNG
jgi:hypothetical protein